MTSYWNDFEKSEFINTSQGQITKYTQAGIEIIKLLQEESGEGIKTIVEVGTWNGRGSTLCILNGVCGSSIENFYSLECNKEKHLSAVDNLKSYINETVHLLWGSIVNPEYISSEEYKSNFPKLLTSEMHRKWFEIDIQNCRGCPHVLEQLPERIDLLVLDGGEYTTLNELEILLSRCSNYIILDDTKEDKCRECRNILLTHESWDEIYSLDERNGFSIFKKKQYLPR